MTQNANLDERQEGQKSASPGAENRWLVKVFAASHPFAGMGYMNALADTILEAEGAGRLLVYF